MKRFALLLAIAVTVPALGRAVTCEPREMKSVASLAELPQDVGALLGVSKVGLDGIADRGGEFNRTDVVEHNLPMRRFALGEVSDSCVVVAIEIGGFGPHVEILAFKHGNNGWSSSLQGSQAEVPDSLSAFVPKNEPGASFLPFECEALAPGVKATVETEDAAIARAKDAWASSGRGSMSAHEVARSEPYRAALVNSAWHVYGTVMSGAGERGIGGTPEASVCLADGHTRIWHSQ